MEDTSNLTYTKTESDNISESKKIISSLRIFIYGLKGVILFLTL